MDTLAKRLTWAREKKGMTQGALATAAKVSQSTIGNLEAGMRNTCRKIAVIASILDVDALWLAEGIGRPENGGENNIRLASIKDDTETSPDEYAEIVRLFGKAPQSAKEEALRILSVAIKARARKKSGAV
jgi:transcriptional regulator with XRE-family HTH domain